MRKKKKYRPVYHRNYKRKVKMKQIKKTKIRRPEVVSDKLGDVIAKDIRKIVEKNKLCGSCKK